MGLAKYPHALYVKLLNEMYKVNEVPCCKKIWLLLLIQLMTLYIASSYQNTLILFTYLSDLSLLTPHLMECVHLQQCTCNDQNLDHP